MDTPRLTYPRQRTYANPPIMLLKLTGNITGYISSTEQQSHHCLGPLKLCHYLLRKGVTQNGTETVFG